MEGKSAVWAAMVGGELGGVIEGEDGPRVPGLAGYAARCVYLVDRG